MAIFTNKDRSISVIDHKYLSEQKNELRLI